MTTTAKPTRGRIIEVTSNLWEGKRPATIVSVVGPDENPMVRANVMLDGTTDQKVLDLFRVRNEGNTVTLEYGVQNPEPGLALPLPGDRDWFCGFWMPFQVGQVPASLAVQGDLTAAKEAIAQLQEKAGQNNATLDRVVSIADRMSRQLETQVEISLEQRVATDRLKDALGYLAEKLQRGGPEHPRHQLYSGVMRILDGKDPEDDGGRPKLLLSEVTKANHEAWLAGGDRSYSPHNKPWDELTPQAQDQIALTVRNTLKAVYDAMGVKADEAPEIIDDLGRSTPPEPAKPIPEP
jgi:hypothetical protein